MTAPVRLPARPRRDGQAERARGFPWGLLLLPALAVLALAFGYPVMAILFRSLDDFLPSEAGQGAFANYRWVVGEPVNVTVLLRTFRTALLVTVVSLLLSYPYAYLMTVVGRLARSILLGIVLLTFWTSLMVRNYAWLILLQDNGVVNQALGRVGVGPVHLIGTTAGVVIGMCQILVPFMLLPLYATLRGIDRRLLLAAQSLGARPAVAFARVYLPLSAPGIAAGALLVFVMSLGFYITPAVLGSPQNALFSQLIVTQVSNLLAWGRGGAMAALLLVGTFACLAIAALVSRAGSSARLDEAS
jgi:putative spermidine/putrescine transport system permease protein